MRSLYSFKCSVKKSTRKTYDRALKPVIKFLTELRDSSTVQVHTCSEDEFLSFLVHWKEQGLCVPQGTWRAVVFVMRCEGLQSNWLLSDEMKKMLKGAG